MTYTETVNWMFKQLPMYQNQGKSAYKANLDNTILLANYLENPHRNFKSVHVGGTNGKGSTSHMIASILQEAGYTVGLYTSPHLKDFRERIKINGINISKQFVISFIKKHKSFFEANALSFFEMTVGMAFEYFSKKNVDIAIIEVGLGGRLDSTNIITPEVSVITNIGLDHTQFLGNTLEAIAKEKAGIIKPNIPVVIGETQKETKQVFIEYSEMNKSPIEFADVSENEVYDTDLKGKYQKLNVNTAVSAIKHLKQKEFSITKQNIEEGLKNVVKNTGLLGRWQILQEEPKIICDTAHNKEGLKLVMSQLRSEVYDNLHIVIGVVKDKDLSTIIPLLPKDAVYYCCKPSVERGLDATSLTQALKDYNLKAKHFSNVREAFIMAKNNAESNDLIYVGGSTFTVAEIL
ncbi:Mur ligase family protein [Winogradskyella sp. 3972H.M.0a.05]|uniref:bifunctional folylpolyglutamate synthase/dihydrofolate synthase n=1 Tax=Winogradskyella sp. 3972H.M.0a.05 TaxID=2950277 RepID=UPI003392E444